MGSSFLVDPPFDWQIKADEVVRSDAAAKDVELLVEPDHFVAAWMFLGRRRGFQIQRSRSSCSPFGFEYSVHLLLANLQAEGRPKVVDVALVAPP